MPSVSVSYRNHSFDFFSKSNDWFLYEMQHWAEIGRHFGGQKILVYSCAKNETVSIATSGNFMTPALLNYTSEYVALYGKLHAKKTREL